MPSGDPVFLYVLLVADVTVAYAGIHRLPIIKQGFAHGAGVL